MAGGHPLLLLLLLLGVSAAVGVGVAGVGVAGVGVGVAGAAYRWPHHHHLRPGGRGGAAAGAGGAADHRIPVLWGQTVNHGSHSWQRVRLHTQCAHSERAHTALHGAACGCEVAQPGT